MGARASLFTTAIMPVPTYPTKTRVSVPAVQWVDSAVGLRGADSERLMAPYHLDTLKVPYSAPSKDPRRAFFNTGVTQQHDISYRVGDNQNYFGLRAVQRGRPERESCRMTNTSGTTISLSKRAGPIDKFAANGTQQSLPIRRYRYQKNGDFNHRGAPCTGTC